jgi:hypothetical protein
MKKPYKYLLFLILCISSIIIGFYIYAAYEFSKVAEESTIGVIEFISKDKNKTVTIYDEDSMKSILDSSNFSFFLESLLNEDTVSIKIWRNNSSLSEE